MTTEITITRAHWGEMLADVTAHLPYEACGIVSGRDGRSTQVIPVTNFLKSQTAYRMDPQEQLAAFLALEDQNWGLLAIYHSHPEGPQSPSPRDLSQAYYPDTVNLIWSLTDGTWQCRGYKIAKDTYAGVKFCVE